MNLKYSNPVRRGFFPDPSVIRVGKDYYMVNSSFQYFPAIPISHSKDMVNWEVIGHAITDSNCLDLSEIRDSRGIWAPDISYHDGKFYIFATLRHNETDEGLPLRSQLLMISDKPEGPYSKPVILPVDNIDPSHFIDDDGKHYMIIAPGITIVPLSDDCTKVTGEIEQVWEGTGERCPEGPHILKKDGWYYAIIAEGGTGYGHGINVARSRELYGQYEPSPYNPVMRQLDANALIQRTGHGKLVQTQSGEWWCYYLCGRRNGGNYTTIGRETALDPVKWTEDGWFLINDGEGPSIEQDCPKGMDTFTVDMFKFDDFDNANLNLNWEWVRNPDKKNYSLTERKGFLRLYTLDEQLFEIRAKNTLLRREQELAYTAKTKLEFTPNKMGHQAGITCYYSTASYARFSLCYEDDICLEIVINRNEGEERVHLVRNIENKAIHLKVEVDGLKRSFYYSYDNENWYLAGVLDNCVYLCDEGVPGDPKRHTGTLVGIYANNGGNGDRIAADFDWFSYED